LRGPGKKKKVSSRRRKKNCTSVPKKYRRGEACRFKAGRPGTRSRLKGSYAMNNQGGGGQLEEDTLRASQGSDRDRVRRKIALLVLGPRAPRLRGAREKKACLLRGKSSRSESCRQWGEGGEEARTPKKKPRLHPTLLATWQKRGKRGSEVRERGPTRAFGKASNCGSAVNTWVRKKEPDDSCERGGGGS